MTLKEQGWEYARRLAMTSMRLSDTVYLTIVPIMRARKVIGMTVQKMTKTRPRTPTPNSIVIGVTLEAAMDIFDWSIPMTTIEVPASAVVTEATAKIVLSK